MDRDELAKVFYGEGAVPAVWATGCPVRFDVWLAFAKPVRVRRGGDYRVDLILAINEEHGTRRVLDHFQRLNLEHCEPIAAGSLVSARMTLEELVRAILPMTNLAGLVRLAQDVGADGIQRALEGDLLAPPESNDPTETAERMEERSRHFVWLVQLLRTVIDARRPRRRKAHPPAAEAEVADEALIGMLLSSVAERSLTRWPGDPTKQVIDRRRRYPILSVTTNRPASPAVTRSRTTVKADAAEQLFSVDSSAIGWAVVDSGIDAAHPAFREWWIGPDGQPQQGALRIVRAFNFVGARSKLSADAPGNGLVDWTRALPYLEIQLPEAPPPPVTAPAPLVPYTPPVDPHGTHVAGIIGGSWPERGRPHRRSSWTPRSPALRGRCWRLLRPSSPGPAARVLVYPAGRRSNRQPPRSSVRRARAARAGAVRCRCRLGSGCGRVVLARTVRGRR